MVCLEHYVSPAHIKVERGTIREIPTSSQCIIMRNAPVTGQQAETQSNSYPITVVVSKAEAFFC